MSLGYDKSHDKDRHVIVQSGWGSDLRKSHGTIGNVFEDGRKFDWTN